MPENLVFSVEGLDPDVAVFTEPAACAMHGLETLQVRPGSTALVFGAGPTGLLLAQLIASGGASSVTVAAPDASSSSMRRTALGVDETVLIDRADPEGNARSSRDGLAGGDGYDFVVEATGSPDDRQHLRPADPQRRHRDGLRRHARDEDLVQFHPFDVFRREITIKGSFAEMTSFAAAIARCDPAGPGPTASSPTGSPWTTTARRSTPSPGTALRTRLSSSPSRQRRIARPSEVNTHDGADRTAERRTGTPAVTSAARPTPRRPSGPRGQRARSLDAQQNTRKGLRPHTRWYIT